MEEGKLRVGVVGFGKMGILHASILNFLPMVKLVAVCEKSGLIRRFLKKIFENIYVVDDVEKLSEFILDSVYVTTPITSHFSVLKSIYDLNITANVFVEKPLASSFEESKQICKWAGNSHGVNMVGYLRRFSVTFRKAKNLLDQGIIGEPVSFTAYAYSSDFYGISGNSKVNVPNAGVLRELGCHAVDLALWFFGDLRVKNARKKSFLNKFSEDSVFFNVETCKGVSGEFDVSWCVDKYRMPEVGFLINGSGGVLKVNDDQVELNVEDREKTRWFRHDLNDDVDFWLGAPEYFREDEYFIKAVINGQRVEPDFYSSSAVDWIIDEVKEKAKENDQRD